jgi:hypothetical protein
MFRGVAPALRFTDEDIFLKKPRYGAFHGTDLELGGTCGRTCNLHPYLRLLIGSVELAYVLNLAHQ